MKFRSIMVVVLLLGMMMIPSIAVGEPGPGPETKAAWVIATYVYASDMDGGGTPLGAGDTVTINNGGKVTIDLAWGGSDGSVKPGLFTVNDRGIFVQNESVILLTDGVAVDSIHLNIRGRAYWNGTEANPCVFGGDVGVASAEVEATSGGVLTASYTTFQYLTDGTYSFRCGSYGGVLLRNCTITNSDATLVTDGGVMEMQECTWADAGKALLITNANGGTTIVRNCIFTTSGANWISCGAVSGHPLGQSLILLGNNTVGGARITATAPGDASTSYNPVLYYNVSMINETNGLSDCFVSTDHPSLNVHGRFWDSHNQLEYLGTWGTPASTNATGETILYELSAVRVMNVVRYYSDGTQAEAGDNQRWNRSMSLFGYVVPSPDLNWSGNDSAFTLVPVGAGTERANQTIRTYSDENTTMANLSSLFEASDDVWINGTITIDTDVANVNINVSIHNETDWVQDILPTTTQSFSAGIMMNLTEINGDVVMRWAAPINGQHYVRLSTWKPGEIESFNVTEDFLIAPVFNKYMDYQTFTTNETGFLCSYMNTTGRLRFNGTFDSDQPITGMWINSSVFDELGVWQRTLIENQTFNMVAGRVYNITDDIMGGTDLWVNATNYSIGEFFVGTRLNKTGEFGNIQIISQFTIGIPTCNISVRTYNDSATMLVASRYDEGWITWINGTIEIDNTVPEANINITIRRLGGVVQNWTFNGTWNFTADIQYNLTEITNRTLNWTATLPGPYYVQVDVWLDDIIGCFNETEDFRVIDLITLVSPGTPPQGGAIFPTPILADASQLDMFLAGAGIYLSDNVAQLIVLSGLLLFGILIIVFYQRKKRKGER